MLRRTLYQMFMETVQAHPESRALGYRPEKNADYIYFTYSELSKKVKACRRSLDAIGLHSGDRIALLAENRWEWAVVDLAAHSLGIINVAPYVTLPAPQVAFIVNNSGAKALFVSDGKQRSKVAQFRNDSPALEYVIAMDGEPEHLEEENCLTFSKFLQLGADSNRTEQELENLSTEVDPYATATFIYTSGTTGEPKGAMLSHMNILQTPDALVDEPIADIGATDVFLSFLPLSHITERVGGYYIPIRVGACIVYSQGLSSFAEELTQTVRPTCMLCVPRLFENMYSKFKDSLEKQPEKRQKIVKWAIKIGEEVSESKSEGKSISLLLKLKFSIADKKILSKIREKVTGGKLRFCVSGGAPLDHETAAFFLGIGIQILEGYGLSECNIIAINRPGRQRIGTVGILMPEVEFKIADDGEFLMRGQGKMSGYFNSPEATADAIDSEGWFHTGDIGERSLDGYVKITDRKKDLLVLTNGKKVAPQPIEAQLKLSEYIAEAVLFGDKQATVMAILAPAFDKLLAWAKSTEFPTADIAELLVHPEVLKLYKKEIEEHTRSLAEFEKIKRFKLVDKPFSIEGGELTPTLKVKRKFVAEKYAVLLESMARSS